MQLIIAQIAAAVIVAGLTTVAGVTGHISGEAVTGVYTGTLGYIFGIGGNAAVKKGT